jgi:hypothetical protein
LQDLFPGQVDTTRLIECPVVHPDDDVARGILGRADRQRPPPLVDHDQRAGGGETEPGNGAGCNAALRNRSPDGSCDSLPNVVGGLLDDLAGFVPGGDRVLCRAEKRARRIEDTGACRASPDVHTDETAIRHAIPLAHWLCKLRF